MGIELKFNGGNPCLVAHGGCEFKLISELGLHTEHELTALRERGEKAEARVKELEQGNAKHYHQNTDLMAECDSLKADNAALRKHIGVMMEVHCPQPGFECGVCEHARALLSSPSPGDWKGGRPEAP